jgi:hypothetical protein
VITGGNPFPLQSVTTPAISGFFFHRQRVESLLS